MKEKRKLSPLKVGEKVVVYEARTRPMKGHDGSFWGPWEGTVSAVGVVWGTLPGYIKAVDPYGGEHTIHPKQCRRLKPKKAPAAPERERESCFVERTDLGICFNFGHRKTEIRQSIPTADGSAYAHLVELREGERILSLADLKRAWDTVIAPSAWWGGDYSGGPHFNEMLQNLGFREEREP